jgi:hypothetical protein
VLVVLACLALGGGLGGCKYQPEVPEGVVRCDPNQRCPEGSLCYAVREGATVMLVCCRTPGCSGNPAAGPSPPLPPPTTASDAAVAAADDAESGAGRDAADASDQDGRGD